MKRPGVLASLLFIGGCFPLMAQRPVKLETSGFVNVQVKEPSDIVSIPGAPGRFFVVSDNGYVVAMRSDGSIAKNSGDVAFDLEGALLHDGELLVMDERARRMLWLDTADLRVKRRLTFPYAGGRNKAYEALAWNPTKQRYLLITERESTTVFELDNEFRVTNEVEFDRGIRDISSACWHGDFLWLLSDMDMLVLKCDPNDYHILERWYVPVVNPEGITFGANGELLILSDDRQRLYTFPFPPQRAD